MVKVGKEGLMEEHVGRVWLARTVDEQYLMYRKSEVMENYLISSEMRSLCLADRFPTNIAVLVFAIPPCYPVSILVLEKWNIT